MSTLKTSNLFKNTPADCAVTAFNFDTALDKKAQGFNKSEHDDSDFYFYGKSYNSKQFYKNYANEKMNKQTGIIFLNEFFVNPENQSDYFKLLSLYV